jgi:pyruvate carboxylase
MAKWVKEQPQCLVMDTTMRDAHQVILEQFIAVYFKAVRSLAV